VVKGLSLATCDYREPVAIVRLDKELTLERYAAKKSSVRRDKTEIPDQNGNSGLLKNGGKL